MKKSSKSVSGLLSLCVGDVLGVPVEFTSRSERINSPVISMLGYGTWDVPAGTWSDDSSLTFCLAECLCERFSLYDIANSFYRWYHEGYWTASGEVFDIGNTTFLAIADFQQGVPPLQAGGKSENSNGNGSLMRILPMAYCYKKLAFSELIFRTHQVSCITHAHLRSQMACGIYVTIAMYLLEGDKPQQAYEKALRKIQTVYSSFEYTSEISHFNRIFSGNIANLSLDEIQSGGYVIHTLEASLWCFLNSSSYSEAVLKAVNLGGDTDTTGAVTGGLAGIYYGVDKIREEWIEQIPRKQDIMKLAERFDAVVFS